MKIARSGYSSIFIQRDSIVPSVKRALNYHVNVTIQDDSHALAATRGHRLSLNVKKGAGEAGFNAAETLLAAVQSLPNIGIMGNSARLLKQK